MTTTHTPDVHALAAKIVELVRADMAEDPELFAPVTRYAELHDVVDANMYAADAAHAFGLGDLHGEPLFSLLNAAEDIADDVLFPKLTEPANQ